MVIRWSLQIVLLISLIAISGCGQTIAPHSDPIARVAPPQPVIPPERLTELRIAWTAMTDQATGGLGTDLPRATARLEDAIRSWTSTSGVVIEKCIPVPASRPEPGKHPEGDFRQAEFNIEATGSLGAAAHFIYKAETAAFPVRIMRLQIDNQPGREGEDKLVLHVTLSTLSIAPGLPQAGDSPQAAVAEASRTEYAQHWRPKPRYLKCLTDLTNAFSLGTYVTHLSLDDAMAGSLTGKSLQPLEASAAKVKSAMDKNARFKNLAMQMVRERSTAGIEERAFSIRFQYDPDAMIQP